ncbi:Pentatricopeptide repeat-containing protein [Nymphaea thermarum]|nr:Pentatricopeptide repeat-containing protein [Nymphaea thermarum]
MDELRQIHAHLIKARFIHQNLALSRLLLFSATSKSGSLDYAHKVFDEVPQRNTFLYNTMIRGYQQGGDARTAFLFYLKMVEDSIPPDRFTFPFVLSCCSDLCCDFEGKQIHTCVVKNPMPFTIHTQNSLLHFYVKHGRVEDAHKVFVGIEAPDIVSWNSLMDGYVKKGELAVALNLFNEMPRRDVVSWTTMLVGCVKHGLLEDAHKLLENMPEKNVVSWSAIIDGYVQLGRYKEAVDLFRFMQDSKIVPDKFIMTTVLSACGRTGALDQGKWLHAYIDKNGIEIDAYLATALIDMYAKCGCLDDAIRVFQDATDKKVFLWNAILGGFAVHSRAQDAVDTFLQMLERGTHPNEITFISVLSACSHAGLVDLGLQIFDDMRKVHRVTPRVEHYVCMVDLLGRAGLLDRAKSFVETMPMQPDGNVMRALLNACVIHGNFDLGETIGKTLLEVEPEYDGHYVLLSNMYARAGRWADVATIRTRMRMKGVNKLPGCSSIELEGAVHQFFAGDRSHPQSEEIYSILNDLSKALVNLQSVQINDEQKQEVSWLRRERTNGFELVAQSEDNI